MQIELTKTVTDTSVSYVTHYSTQYITYVSTRDVEGQLGKREGREKKGKEGRDVNLLLSRLSFLCFRKIKHWKGHERLVASGR